MGNQIWAVIVIALIVAVVVSVASISIFRYVIGVYTKTEVDSIINTTKQDVFNKYASCEVKEGDFDTGEQICENVGKKCLAVQAYIPGAAGKIVPCEASYPKTTYPDISLLAVCC